MKALSIYQPWATLIVLGAKRVETRCWHTGYRGRMVIHASRTFNQAARELCRREPFASLLRQGGVIYPHQLPRGAVLGAVDLVECQRAPDVAAALPDLEWRLGDYRPGRWAWRLENAVPFAMPIPYRGRLGLFDVPDEVCWSGIPLP